VVIVVNLLIESEREEWEEEGKAKGTKELHRYPSPYDSPTFLTACFSMAGSKQRSWIHVTAFVAIAVISVYVVLEIEYPRSGFIRYTAYDQVLVELRQSMQ